MKILFVTHLFPPRYNSGTETYTFELAQKLIQLGHTVTVVCAEDWESGSKYINDVTEDVYQTIPVIRFHLNWKKAQDPNKVLYDSAPIEHWFDDYLSKKQFDVAHVTSTMTLGIGVLRSLNRYYIPIVLTLMDFWFICPNNQLIRSDGELCEGDTTPLECQHCLMKESHISHKIQKYPSFDHFFQLSMAFFGKSKLVSRTRGFKGFLINMEERKTELPESIHHVDRVISHSHFLAKLIQKRIPVHIDVIKNGQELSWTQGFKKTNSKQIRFTYLGQIQKNKGVHILIEAFCKAKIQNSARLDIWGDNKRNVEYYNYLRSLAKNNVAISFRGRFDHNQLKKVLADSDVVVVPSIWYENAPLVIQEAFAARIPVITANLGGMAEAVTDGLNGLLFLPGDIDDLTRKLERIVLEKGLVERLSSGISPIKKIDEEVDDLILIYERLVREHVLG